MGESVLPEPPLRPLTCTRTSRSSPPFTVTRPGERGENILLSRMNDMKLPIWAPSLFSKLFFP